jgi:adenosylcobinamide hydrolase
VVGPQPVRHSTCGDDRPALVWRFPEPRVVASTATVGGGLGQRDWIVNAQVPLLTAAGLDVRGLVEEAGVVASATVGVSKPTWAADADDAVSPWTPGTINVVVELPVRLTDAAMLNAIVTATEAKAQALFERGVPGTGTASDAVCVSCPVEGPEEPFAGPRSTWGARLGRAVHAAVLEGLER